MEILRRTRGGFLSAGATWRPQIRMVVFQIGNGAFLFGALILALRYQWSRLAAGGPILFVAGGLSNLIDRVAVGSVIDFLNIGVGLLLADRYRSRIRTV